MVARYAIALLPRPIASPALALVDGPTVADEASKEFEAATLPLVKRYCLECHSTEEQEGDLDLERFTSLDHARNAPRIWQRVVEMLDKGEMPPKEAPQPDVADRGRLLRWGAFLTTEATRRAGDLGLVVLRRLNNAIDELFYACDPTGASNRSTRLASSRSMERRAKGSPIPAMRW